MAMTLPDKGEGQSDLQSIFFQEYLDALVAGINGVDCVLKGGDVTAQGSPDMTVAVAKGSVLTNKILKGFAAGNVTIATADATNPRLDLIVVDSSGAKAARAGTPAAFVPYVSAPKPPAKSANDVVLAVVYVPANDTTISSAQITDMRVMRSVGPINIYQDTTSVATNNTTSPITVLSLVIPSGLFLGSIWKTIHARIGVNWLHNSGTPTLTLTVSYGGTTLYSGVSGASAADSDRTAWTLWFDLVAQGSSDQHLSSMAYLRPGVVVAPATGIDSYSTGSIAGPSGASAVDSDAADRTLLVTVTMNVANAANEIVKEYALVTIE